MVTASPRPRVAVTCRLPPAVEAAIAERFDVVGAPSDEASSATSLQRALGEADGIVCSITDRFTAEVLAAYPIRTRILANYGVGTDHIDLAAAAAHDIVVTNTPDVLTECTADLTMTLMLMTMRRAGEGERELRAGRWQGWAPTHHLGRKVSGKTLGLVGSGRIARAVSARAHFGFGMRVIYFNPNPPNAAALAAVGAEARPTLDALLVEADVVSLHCPSTPETRGMMNDARIGRMKAGAVLVNTARGDLVDDDALIAALRAGHLLGAGLDVYLGEPEVDSRYLSLENVVLLPHLGSATRETREAMGFRAIDNLDAFLSGREPPDRVRREHIRDGGAA